MECEGLLRVARHISEYPRRNKAPPLANRTTNYRATQLLTYATESALWDSDINYSTPGPFSVTSAMHGN